jgi:hypothetical protein
MKQKKTDKNIYLLKSKKEKEKTADRKNKKAKPRSSVGLNE